MRPDFEPLDIALDKADSLGASDSEAYLQKGVELTARAFDGTVEKFSSAEARGMGIRVFLGDRQGRAYTSDLTTEATSEAVSSAVSSAEVSPGDPDRALPDSSQFPPGYDSGEMMGENLEIWGGDLEEVSPGEKIDFALRLESLAREYDPRIIGVETATYSESSGQVALANSRGFRACYRASICYGYLMAIAEQSGESQTGFGFTAGRSFASLECGEASREAAEMAVSLLGGRQVETATAPVLFDNISTAELLAVLSFALSGETVTKGRSFLAGRLGEPVAAQAMSLVDDGLMKGGFGTAPFDDEGVGMSRKSPIDDGVLTGYLHNCYTASRMGTETTGNAGRSSFRSQVGVSPSNIFLEPGDSTPEELRSGMSKGFEVLEIQGVHSGVNPVTGEVSVGAKGMWIDQGKISHAVREVTLAGTMEGIMRGIAGIGNNLRFTPLLGGIGTPSILVEGLVISGR